MRSATVIVLALAAMGVALAAAGEAAAQGKRASAQQEFTRPEELLRWINGYRTKPQPNKVPALVKAASQMGVFRDMETAG
ncbi:MAG TPA: hypothetical protein VFZ16_21340, partial [Hyphomicrobiaceae bacterium]|nr:hypothetical protein [Hyphomicrobiaceae bacterium]HEX6001915.1 hypothetical protein [Hyphomicrobiaceae bacterium]